MYHIFTAQCHAHFRDQQALDVGNVRRARAKLVTTARRRVPSADQNGRLAGTERRSDALESGDKLASPTGKTKAIQRPLSQTGLDIVGQRRRRRRRLPAHPRKQARGDRTINRGAGGRKPQASTRQGAREIGNHPMIRCDHKS